MIPTMMVAGLVVGPLWLERQSRASGLLVAAILAVAWGAVVAAFDGWTVDTFVAGTWLGVANLLVGAAAAVVVSLLVRTLRRSLVRA